METEGINRVPFAAGLTVGQQLVRDFPILRILSGENLGQIESRLLPKRMSNGETLFIKGQPENFLALVVSGQIHTILYGPSGRQLVLEDIGPGKLVGETALFDGGARMTSACSVGPTRLLILPRAHFGLLQCEPAFMQAIAKLLCQRLHHSANLLESVSLHRLESRLARFLLDRVAQSSPGMTNGAEVLLPANQGVLATMINVSRPKLNAQLQSWLRSGVVSWQQDRLRILDIEQLKLCANA